MPSGATVGMDTGSLSVGDVDDSSFLVVASLELLPRLGLKGCNPTSSKAWKKLSLASSGGQALFEVQPALFLFGRALHLSMCY